MKIIGKKLDIYNSLLAICFLIMAIPMILILIVLIRLDSSGKAIFRQTRIGHQGKRFKMYKLRTMIDNAELIRDKYQYLNSSDGPTFKIKDDPRFTRIGKFLSHSNLDELPQLINVIKGDMKIVGFRPPLPREVEKYEPWQLKRFKGYPGMTSTWAIFGSHSISFPKWVKMDIEYEKQRSFRKDLWIILKTIKIPLRSLGRLVF